MSDIKMRIQPLLLELIAVLDDEILNARLCIERLNELRSAVIRRKEDELSGLLETVKFQGDDYSQTSVRRRDVFFKLADTFGCNVDDLNLALIADRSREYNCEQIFEKKKTLEDLMNKLSGEYCSTVILLNEFSKLNGIIVKSVFKPHGEVAVYNHKGKNRLSSVGGLFNCRF